MEKLYCVQVRDKISNKFLFMNFIGSSDVAPPENEPSDSEFPRQLLNSELNISHEIDRFRIRFESGQLCESNESNYKGYVVLIRINKDFANRIKGNVFKTTFVISVCMSELQDQLNSPSCQQNVGHKFDLDHANHRVLKDKVWVEPKM